MATTKVNKGTAELPAMVDIVYFLDESLWKEVSRKYKQKLEAEEEELKEYKKHRKTIAKLILCQIGPSLLSQIKQAPDYDNALKDGHLSAMLGTIRGICVVDNNHELTFKPVKALVNQKLLQNTCQSGRPLEEYKEELETRYLCAKAISGVFFCGTASLIYVLKQKGEMFDT